MSADQFDSNSCPLCLNDDHDFYHEDRKRVYLQCKCCHLVFVPQCFHLDAQAEKAEYDRHQNDPQDAGYQKFLSRTTEPLFNQLPQGATGLDFGCGPGPAISVMAERHGFKVCNYDIYYYPDVRQLEKRFDFVTMTEVIEHLAEPFKILNLIDKILNSGGILAIMTKRVIDKNAFSRWHYKNDPTHIAFYSVPTFEWIGGRRGWKLQVIDNDVVFFLKD
ncbi:class I SAM-dependent methyltransferase [Aliikangiella marina]|uniref:Class I SAM-dependent methyltransferase n=1 Tax=Aliikangiella marina TaxID=1712262 RepID=A0A545TCG8_9GAMM|nr:class I SAM-dependent methyltransferase [Aliikangiella marina]TQV74909.1 class I SAM-dependent methyltransferase [Aliikangiella marina]